MNRTCMGVFFLCILLLLTGCGRNSRSDETETFPNETVAEAEEPKEDHMLPETPLLNKIEEQCVDVKLEGQGEVTFVAYAPDQSFQEMGDAVFELEKNGESVYRFPYVMEGNRRPQQSFARIQEVSFQDYDGDEKTDVIILAEYRSLTDSEDSETVMEVRLYRNRPEEKAFVLDTERMNILNRNQWNHTMDEVMDHMGDAGQRLLLDYLTDIMEEGS